MRVLLTTAASVFFVSFCECCNSPRCWLKISYSRALKPSIHAVLLLFRRGSGSLANVKCHDRCKVSSSSFSVSLCLTCIESPVHAVPRASVVASKSFALLRPPRFMPDSSGRHRSGRLRYRLLPECPRLELHGELAVGRRDLSQVELCLGLRTFHRQCHHLELLRHRNIPSRSEERRV